MIRLALALALMLAGCSGQLGTTSVGGCMSGERQRLNPTGTGVYETPQGPITLTAPSGANIALCNW